MAIAEVKTIPLFPLRTVLFPGGPLPLRIFETRYLNMVTECLKSNSEFGVCLIQQGREVGGEAVPYLLGTTARIMDWEKRKDGLLGILAIGQDRFKIRHSYPRQDKLLMGEVEISSAGVDQPLPAKYAELVSLVRKFSLQFSEYYQWVTPDYDSANWVSNRLAEFLPFSAGEKQALLETDDPLERLEKIEHYL